MSPLLHRSAAVAACFLFTATAVRAADAVELKPQWHVGKRYTQAMTMNQQMTMSMGGQKMEQGMTMDIQTVVNVTKHEKPGLKRLGIKYQRMSMSIDMNGQKMGYDSDKPDPGNDPLGMGKALGGLIGKEVTAILAADGKVQEIEKLDELLAGLDAAGPAAAQMKGMFNKDTFAQTIAQAGLHNFPPGPVKPGDSWPLSFQMNMPQLGQMALKGTYAFKGMADHGGVPCAEITNDAQLEFDSGKATGGGGDGTSIQQLGMRFDKGRLSGTTWFDPKLGTARASEMVQEMTIKMANPANPGESIEMPMRQKISTKLVSVEDVK
jgi:hypothetical protein